MPGVRRVDPASRHLQQSLGHHRLGTARSLLAGLEHEDDVAGELFASRRQDVSGADEGCDVEVVAAGVHHARLLGAVVTTHLLVDRQGVHVATEQDHLAWPAGRLRLPPHDGDDGGQALPERDLEVERRERLDDRLLRAGQVVADLGMAVHLATQRHHQGGELPRQSQ